MQMYCPECFSDLADKGIIFPLYQMICENYAIFGGSFSVYEPYFTTALRFLEINGFITTSETAEKLISAKPRTILLDDGQTLIYCSGTCLCRLIDFKGEGD